MIETGVTNSAKIDFLNGLHVPGDVFKLALYTGKASLGPNTIFYSSANEIHADGYEPGGKKLTGHSVIEDQGTAILNFDSPVWENVSISARGAIIYNASKNLRVIAVFDFGKDIISTNSKFAVTMPVATKSQGLIRIT